MKVFFKFIVYLLLILSTILNSCVEEKLPILSTSQITNILGTAAKSGGIISSEGSDPITVCGVCWGSNVNPTIADSKTQDGDSLGIFTSTMTGLNLSTTYYVRAYATNNLGTAYGNQLSFYTGDIRFNPDLNYFSVSDIDENIYKTIQIGAQTWMAENLRTIHFNDGTPIQVVSDATEWSNLSTPAYCYYNNEENSFKAKYGVLYNWYTVNARKLCPAGWHVPSNDEWTILTDYLGGINFAGGKLKETVTNHWLSPNAGATNESGFTALPAGVRAETGQFTYSGVLTAFWSSTPYNYLKPWYRNVNNELSSVWEGNGSLNVSGFSIRCVKD